MSAYLKLGPHTFSILPMSYRKLQRTTGLHIATIGRFGNDDARQFVGRPSPQITIDGLLAPKEFGGRNEYDAIRRTQALGRPVIMVGLMGGFGHSFGRVLIERVNDTQTEIDADGTGKKMTFSIDVVGVAGSLGQPGGQPGGLF